MLSTGFWLRHAVLTWRAELDAQLHPLGLTPTQFIVLASAGWLEHRHGPPTQQEVAEQAGADRMMTSKIDSMFFGPEPNTLRAALRGIAEHRGSGSDERQ